MPKAVRTLIFAILFLATGLVAPPAAFPSEALGHQSPMLPGGVLGCAPGGFSAMHLASCYTTDTVRQLAGTDSNAGASVCVAIPIVDDRCEAWSAIYDHPGGHELGIDFAFDAVTSLDGRTLYVTGESWDSATDYYDFATLAYATETGEVRWLARYAGPLGRHDIPRAMALSPDGSRLYVGGVQNMSPGGKAADYVAVAYETETGAQLWTAVYDGALDDSAWDITVSPDGEWIYMTGASRIIEYQDVDYATVAFRAVDGSLAWTARYSSAPGSGDDYGNSLVTSADGTILYVTGSANANFVTIAYAAGDRADAGQELWTAKVTDGLAYWIARSPDGARIYVTGASIGPPQGLILRTGTLSYTTVAYSAETGGQLWKSTYAGPRPGITVPYGHALSPSGDRLYVTGASAGASSALDLDIATVAIDTSNGAQLWAKRYEMSAYLEIGAAVAVTPDGMTVLVTGVSAEDPYNGDAVTLAYDSTDGDQKWVARFNTFSSYQEVDIGEQVVVAPDGSKAFVTGYAQYFADPSDPLALDPNRNDADYLVLAYDLPGPVTDP